jgi:hypothetical protein
MFTYGYDMHGQLEVDVHCTCRVHNGYVAEGSEVLCNMVILIDSSQLAS